MRGEQGIFWMLTIPESSFTPPQDPPEGVRWIFGQKEIGEATGYVHWQIVVAFSKKVRRSGVVEKFGNVHCELTRSSAANEYVRKANTSVDGTRFEIGQKPIRINNSIDWESVWDCAKKGDLQAIPARIRLVSYRTLRAIAADHSKCVGMERVCNVYWGATGTGKSRRAWDESGLDAYSKDPRSKFWDGYQNERNVVIDEFRGGIDISHMLRWLDRYPVRVEIKGSSKPLEATTIWITSNISPKDWYPDVDDETRSALLRRLKVVEFINFP